MDITEIVNAVLKLIIAVCTLFFGVYVKNKIGDQRFGELKKWVKVGVEAAEMIFNASGLGAKKKEWVIDFLEEKGYDADLDSIDELIEAAVLELKKG